MLARRSLPTLLFVLFLAAFATLAQAQPVPRGLLGSLLGDAGGKCTSGGILSSVFALLGGSCGGSSGTWKTDGGSSSLVTTPYGTVQGQLSLTGLTFTLPYAKSSRWQLSKLTSAWTGTLDGTKLPPSCPQPDSFAASSTMSEDCLSIVVYQPPGNLQNVPVFVWIHGGSFIAGSASAPGLDGRAFAKANGAVVVVVQYRLGVLGLLPPTSARTSTPNLALADVINALTYTRRVVSSFGGNPNLITVAGQSSGGHMIRALLASPKAKGLFQRAILQSDPMSFGMSTPPTTQLVQGAFYSALDQQANATLSLKQLTALDWPTLIAAQAAFTPSAFYLDNAIPVSVPLRPTAAPADAYLPSDFSVALAANTLLSWALAVPLLLTSVADEFGSADGQLNPVAVPAPYYAAELAQFIGETTKVEAILSSAEYALGTGDDAVRDALNKVGTEGFWTCAIRNVAAMWAARGGKVFVGEFQAGAPYPDNQEIAYCAGRVCHEDDIFLTFGTTPADKQTAATTALSKEVVARWGAFAKDGVPAWPAQRTAPKWAAFAAESSVFALGGALSRSCPAGFWGQGATLFDWEMYSA